MALWSSLQVLAGSPSCFPPAPWLLVCNCSSLGGCLLPHGALPLARNVICPANENLFLLWLEAHLGRSPPPHDEMRGPGSWEAGVGGLAGAEADIPKPLLWETFKAAADPHALPEGLELR